LEGTKVSGLFTKKHINDWSTSIIPLDLYQEKLQERRREWEASQPVQPEDRREIDRLTRVLQERERELEEERREKKQDRNRLQQQLEGREQQLEQAQQQGQERERQAREREQNLQRQLQERERESEQQRQEKDREIQQARERGRQAMEREQDLQQQLQEREQQLQREIQQGREREQGDWISPTVTGDRPPPISQFTLTSINNSSAILFGGVTANERSNNVYILNFTDTSVNCLKLSNPGGSVQWPKERCAHSSVLINTSSGPHLLVVGGISDLWIFDIKNKSWKKLFNIPKNFTYRSYHSLSLWSVTPTTNWIIVFGGTTSYRDTAVIELILEGTKVSGLFIKTYISDWSTSVIPLDQYQEKLQERRREWEASQPVQPEDRREIDRLTRVLQEREREQEEERREKEQEENDNLNKHSNKDKKERGRPGNESRIFNDNFKKERGNQSNKDKKKTGKFNRAGKESNSFRGKSNRVGKENRVFNDSFNKLSNKDKKERGKFNRHGEEKGRPGNKSRIFNSGFTNKSSNFKKANDSFRGKSNRVEKENRVFNNSFKKLSSSFRKASNKDKKERGKFRIFNDSFKKESNSLWKERESSKKERDNLKSRYKWQSLPG
uniref:Uncharacterized protein n=1 Tax=Amphimedon queenslandica TaxID=400682 RepID=A0A1X7T928_AMPQE